MGLRISAVLNWLTRDDVVPPQVTFSENIEVARPSTSQGRTQQRKQKKNDTTTSPGADKASGIIGNKIGIDYHFFVAMFLCLNGYKTKQSNPSYKFTIKQESKGVGMFDDIIYEYRENKKAKWTRLLVQIKYKKASDNKSVKIKTSNLLFDAKNETFSLTKFMKSIKDIEDTENCFFIIFTSVCLDIENDGRLRQWYNKGVSLLPSEVFCVPVFDSYQQYKFNDPENIPIFKKYSGIDKDHKEDDWNTFLNKLIFVIGPSDLDHTEKIIKQTIEDILPKSTDRIQYKLYNKVESGLKNRAEITSKQISKLFETVEEEIQEGREHKYEQCKVEFIRNIPVYEFLSSEFTTLSIVSKKSELTLHKVGNEIKKLRLKKPELKKYTLKHVYSIVEAKDIRNAASCNLLIITIQNSDQLSMFQILKNDDQKYITIISNDQNVSAIQNSYQLYRDEDHSFKLLTDESKKYVLDEQCVSLNGQKLSFREILKIHSNSLTQQQIEGLNAIITEDVLICFFKEEYTRLQLNFNREDINKTGVYIKRQLYSKNRIMITEDRLCSVDANTVLISDMPGMGKSSLVSSVFKELQKKQTADIMIRLNFNDHTNSFSKRPALDNLQMIVDFIKNELLAKAKISKLSQNILNYILQTKNRIFIFLDGFDEICPDYNDTVVNFIQSIIKYTNCKLFVTTRPGQTDTLERVLSTSAFSLKPFTKEDIRSYLEQTLGSNYKNMNALSKKINEYLELLAVPLLLKIVTETLHYDNDDKLNIDTIFNLSQLLKEFVNQKFDIYSVEKKLQISTNVAGQKDNIKIQEGYEEDHENLALKLLFGERETSNKIDYEHITKIGIITQVNEERIEFIHRTFAEYFVATHVRKHFNEDRVIRLLLTHVLVKNDLTPLRHFINNYIQEKLNNDETIVKYRRYVNDNYKTIEVNNPVSSILYTAVKENNSQIAIFILECFKQNQSILDSILSYGYNIALQIAIDKSKIEIAMQIINYCDKNKMNKECQAYKFTFGKGVELGLTALHETAKWGHTELVSLLLTKGAIVDITDTYGWTALHRAASWGRTEVISLLLAKDAKVDITDIFGRTALYWAARGGHTEVVSLLLVKGASVNIADIRGRTALYMAVSKSHTEVVSLLLAKGASVNIANTYGETALHEAASGGHTEIVQQLIDHGADVNITNNKGLTALQIVKTNTPE